MNKRTKEYKNKIQTIIDIYKINLGVKKNEKVIVFTDNFDKKLKKSCKNCCRGRKKMRKKCELCGVRSYKQPWS